MIDDSADRDTEPTYHGKVLVGKKRGGQLGYPTANIALDDPALSGIYAARVMIVGEERSYIAAAFADPARGLLEAHLLDFSADLYGRDIEITIFEKIRDAKQFDTDVALIAAIAEDVERVRAYFSR
jgi:riboflavin kinase/FMN adenylyltransferase